jgi:serine/threonine protein kinase
MNADSFRIIERVFHAAQKVPPEARDAFLTSELPDAPDLRHEVENLLAASERGSTFLETSLLAGPVDKPPRTDALVGRQIGPYRLIRELGHGGMGTVYEAEQRWPHRRVALKVVHTGGGDARWSGHEPRILGRLNHPFVASIYDADQTEDGLSYFVMELIEGERLDDYVKQHDLPRRERLVLFCKICEAIQHAHMKSVIHLDLKPSNILVLPPKDPTCQELQVKVVDFGVAAITGSDTTHGTRIGTTGAMVGTLAYMSPEQRRGERESCDVRSDVYSLGVILFKLMTGDLPYPVEDLPLPERGASSPSSSRDARGPSIPACRGCRDHHPHGDGRGAGPALPERIGAGGRRAALPDGPPDHRPSAQHLVRMDEVRAAEQGARRHASGRPARPRDHDHRDVQRPAARPRRGGARPAQAEATKRLTEFILGEDTGADRAEDDGQPASPPILPRIPLEVLRTTAAQLLAQGRAEEAEAEYARLVAIAKLVLPRRNWYAAKLQSEHGECLIRLGRYAQAELPLLSSYEGLRSSYGPEHPQTLEAMRRLVQLYDAWGRPAQSAEWTAQLYKASVGAGSDTPQDPP